MRRMTALIGAAAIVLWTVSAFAQAKANFAGTWVREAPAAPAGGAPPGGGGGGGRGGGGGGGGWGMECTITQTASDLTVKWMQAGRGGGEATPVERAYKLDGSESKNMVAGRGGAEATAVMSKATWDGGKLVIKTTTANGEQTLVVAIDGGNLTLVTTNPGRDGAPPTTGAPIDYKKKM